MANRDIVAIGASYGGLEVLAEIVRQFPREMKAAVFIVLHTAAHYSVLPAILHRNCALPVEHAIDGEVIRHGRVYVAPPDRHMLITDGRIEVSAGAKENNHRPAIDPTFRSAASVFGSRVIGCVLTGYLDDGTSGLMSIKRAGGIAIVQDPEDALAPSMPKSALAFVEVDYKLLSKEIGPKIVALVREPVSVGARAHKAKAQGNGNGSGSGSVRVDESDQFTCPECQGSLVPSVQEGLLRFRCRTGHVYSEQSLDESQYDNLEKALWAALRLLQERSSLMQKLHDSAVARDHTSAASEYRARTKNAREQASSIEAFLRGLSRSRPAETIE